MKDHTRREYLTVFKHYLALIRVIYGFQNDLEMAMVSFAVRVGDLEGRPMDISALANYLELPRTTVIRKVNQLVGGWGFTIVLEGNRTIPHPPPPEKDRVGPTFVRNALAVIKDTLLDLRGDRGGVQNGHKCN
jgi:hypothetical protein